MVEAALAQLAADAFHPSLRTHRLKGKLTGSWACSAGFDLRIVFSFIDGMDGAATIPRLSRSPAEPIWLHP
ncbi:MAG: hypothetical protein WDA75_21630 [Candidatus Latescibacterota bacterium]|jgi:mRNA-degrading endonuclease YafQ of YafQ-DinJ toxin-antitoxin module